ncbi:hypothetical protein GCM10020254_13250 [Streptomyces goshikiensis]
MLERTGVDLLLLDLTLPDGHGLRFARGLRAAGHPVDVIVVTSARDLAVVRESVSVGVVQYVLSRSPSPPCANGCCGTPSSARRRVRRRARTTWTGPSRLCARPARPSSRKASARRPWTGSPRCCGPRPKG